MPIYSKEAQEFFSDVYVLREGVTGYFNTA